MLQAMLIACACNTQYMSTGRVIFLIPQEACMPIVQSIVAHSMLLASLSHDLQVDPNSTWATVTTGKNISFAVCCSQQNVYKLEMQVS